MKKPKRFIILTHMNGQRVTIDAALITAIFQLSDGGACLHLSGVLTSVSVCESMHAILAALASNPLEIPSGGAVVLHLFL